jgi:hypothetical protein
MIMTYSKALAFFGLLACAGTALGQEQDYVKIGQASVAGFRCATLAAHARYREKEIRLVTYGLSNARVFVKATREGKVSIQDFNRSEFILPLVMRAWSFNPLEVPIDFSAGQIYEAVWEQTTAELGDKTRKIEPLQEKYQQWARAEYHKQNCELIGK